MSRTALFGRNDFHTNENRDLHLNTKNCDTSFSYFKKFTNVESQLSALPYVICGALVNYKNYI